jgi:hypothetical protein
MIPSPLPRTPLPSTASPAHPLPSTCPGGTAARPATGPGPVVTRHRRTATLAGAVIGLLSAGVLVASGDHLPDLPNHPSDLPTWVHRHGSAVAVATALRMVGLALAAYGAVVILLALLARRLISLRAVVASLPGNWARRLARSLLGAGLGAGLLGAPSTLAVAPAAAAMADESNDQAPTSVVVDLHSVSPATPGPSASPHAGAATMIPLDSDAAPDAKTSPDPTAPPAPPGSPRATGSPTSPTERTTPGRPDHVARDTPSNHGGGRRSETVRTERAPGTDEGLRADEGVPTGIDDPAPRTRPTGPDVAAGPEPSAPPTTVAEVAPGSGGDLATAAPPRPSTLVMRALDAETEELRPTGALDDDAQGDRALERVDASSGDLDSASADHLWEVALGDHLWAIAAETVSEVRPAGSDDEVLDYWRQLVDTNQERLVDPANPDLLIPGQVLVLPPVD